MATAAPLRSLEEEVTCSICLDYLRDPVTIDCGHVFCRSCTADIRPASGGRPVCPLCKKPFKKENTRPVWQLASLVENIERLKVDKGRPPGDAAREQQDTRLCTRHREKLHYYCEDDGQLLCVLCRESREHRPHVAVLLEKAAQPHRVSPRRMALPAWRPAWPTAAAGFAGPGLGLSPPRCPGPERPSVPTACLSAGKNPEPPEYSKERQRQNSGLPGEGRS